MEYIFIFLDNKGGISPPVVRKPPPPLAETLPDNNWEMTIETLFAVYKIS